MIQTIIDNKGIQHLTEEFFNQIRKARMSKHEQVQIYCLQMHEQMIAAIFLIESQQVIIYVYTT